MIISLTSIVARPGCQTLRAATLAMFCGYLLLVLTGLHPRAAATAQERTTFPSRQVEQQVLHIHAATDLVAMEPLIRAFQMDTPGLSIIYVEYNTNELFAHARSRCGQTREIDLLISSAVDQLVWLVNNGCGARHNSATTAAWPEAYQWRGEVFGFTFEPAVIAFNTTLVMPYEVPRSRAELIDLLRAYPERFDGKIGTYDVEKSGVGYLFAQLDAREGPIFGRLLETLGRANSVTRCCTTDLIEEISSGKLAIGYNLLGSYAVGMQRRGAPIGVVLPSDYTIALSRAAMIPAGAPNQAAARQFIDFLLSRRGQDVAAKSSFFFAPQRPLPAGAEGPNFQSSPGLLRQIRIGPALLAVQDEARRRSFLQTVRQSLSTRASN